jgi:prolyl-tRNA synthetase
LGDYTFRTLAPGGSFTTGFTDEFQTLSKAGEDIIYVDKNKKLAINKEILTDENISLLGLKREDLIEEKSIEVGNIFPLGTKYSDAIGLKIKDEKGNEQSVIMGSYGIGLGRLMGTIVEVLSDEKGIVWPESVAPFKVHLVSLGTDEKVLEQAENLYKKLIEKNVEVLWDDRDLRPGEKFSDSDLIGIPYRVVVSAKTIEANVYEVKGRIGKEAEMMTEDELFAKVA